MVGWRRSGASGSASLKTDRCGYVDIESFPVEEYESSLNVWN